MPKSIVWSDNAMEDISNLVQYLTLHWGKKLAEDYIHLMDELIQRFAISQNYILLSTEEKRSESVLCQNTIQFITERKEIALKL